MAPHITDGNGGPTPWNLVAAETPPTSETTTETHVGAGTGASANENHHALSTRDNPYHGTGLGPWLPEIALCAFGTSCCAVVVSVAHLANGRQPPGIDPLGNVEISFTALLALFSEFTKMALTPVLASSLVQLSLVGFAMRGKPLVGHLHHEAAARGPWGACKLFFRFAKETSWLARLAALFVLSSLLTGPVTQLALGIDMVSVPTGEPNAASVPVSRVISRWNGTHFITESLDRTTVLQAINTGAFPQNNTDPYIQPQCSTGNCDFPVVASLGICHAVSNITKQARNSSAIQGVVLAQMDSLFKRTGDSNPPVMGDPPIFMLAVAANDRPTGAFDQAIVDTTSVDLILAFSNEPVLLSSGVPSDFSSFQFVEVAFHLCTIAYETRVRNGTATTVELSRKAKILSPSPGNASTTLNINTNPRFMDCYNPALPPCRGFGGRNMVFAPPDEVPTSSAGAGQLWIDLWTALSLSFIIQVSVAGGILQTAELTVFVRSGDATLALSTALFGDQLGLQPYPPDVQLQNVERTASNIARALSNSMRLLTPAAGQTPTTVGGTAYTLRAVYTARWYWLSLIIIQTAAAWLILLRTLWLSWRCRLEVVGEGPLAIVHMIMRSNILPWRVSHVRELLDVARNTVARLYRDRVDGFLKFCPAECANMGCHEDVFDGPRGVDSTEGNQRSRARLRKRSRQCVPAGQEHLPLQPRHG